MIFNHSFKHFWNLKENRFVIVRLPFSKIRVMSATSNLTGKVLFSKALVRRFCKNEVFNSDQCFNIFDGILLWVMMIMMNFFFRNGWPKKNDINPYFQPGAMSEVPTIWNIRHTTSRIWACEDQSTGFVEWSCAVVISATPKRHEWWLFLNLR